MRKTADSGGENAVRKNTDSDEKKAVRSGRKHGNQPDTKSEYTVKSINKQPGKECITYTAKSRNLLHTEPSQ